jgi:hypothetical protein
MGAPHLASEMWEESVYPASGFAMEPPRIRYLVRASSFSALFCCLCVAGAGQAQSIANETHFSTNPTRLLVCDKGVGSFQGRLPESASSAHVTVSVGAARQNNGFAARACQAKLSWGHHALLVASEAAQADIDVMGADLGLGSLVVAFQIKATEADPLIKYEIYSLNKSPKLLRTITGEDFFSAADTRLYQTVEIWTTDAAAVNGFENLPRSAFDFAPTVVLRFEDKKLIDVSSEFRPHFDQQIALLRSQLNAPQLSDFRNSDGELSNDRSPTKDPLLATKIKVLELVWCYLYSGREQDAWKALAAMWPPADLERIRAVVMNAQSRGLRSQVDGVSHKGPPPRPRHSEILEPRDFIRTMLGSHESLDLRARYADTEPRQLLLKIPPPPDPKDWSEERKMELVIDEAGKVRSAAMPEEPDKDWIAAAAGWKYIPAFKDGHPAAFRLYLDVHRDR